MNSIRILCFLMVMLVYPGAAAERLFPLDAGNYWQYETADGKHSLEISVSLPIISGGRTYHYVRGYLTERALLRESPGQGVFLANTDTLQETLVTSLDAAGTPVFLGALRPCGTVTGRVSAQRESLLTITGFWNDLLRIHYDAAGCGEDTVASELYAPGIGMIQRKVRTATGERTYDLVTARIGRSILQAHSFAMMSVIAYPPAQGDTSLRFKVQVLGSVGAEPPFRFATTQRYDLIIRDQSGRALWQYSNGKIFPPENWPSPETPSYNVEVPLDDLPGKSIAPGVYRVEAWITSSDDKPIAAAATMFAISDFGQPPVAQSKSIFRTVQRPGGALPLPGRQGMQPYRN